MKKFYLPYLFYVPAIIILAFSGWLFYIADCSTVQAFWLFTHVPGRCI